MQTDPTFPLLGNGLADWLMALAGLASIGVSIWAIILAFRSLKAAQDANATSAQAVADTRETGKKQVRAYLTSVHVSFHQFEVNKPIEIIITWKNMGQTPATDVRITGALELFEGETPRFIDVQFIDGASTTVLASQEETVLFVHYDAPTPEIFERFCKRENSYLLVAGCLYKDVFGDDHKTLMRSRVTWVNRQLRVHNEPYGNEMT